MLGLGKLITAKGVGQYHRIKRGILKMSLVIQVAMFHIPMFTPPLQRVHLNIGVQADVLMLQQGMAQRLRV